MNNMINGYLIAVGSSNGKENEENKGNWVKFTHKFYGPDQTMDVRIAVFDETLICEIKGLAVQVRDYMKTNYSEKTRIIGFHVINWIKK